MRALEILLINKGYVERIKNFIYSIFGIPLQEKTRAVMGNRKGQVTVFIILGILLLFSAIAYFYFTSNRANATIKPAIEQVPTEFQPINSYVEQCVIQIGVEGLKKLGEHGGYIYPQKYGLTSGSEPTEGSMVTFSPGSDLSIPYWLYLRSKNTCVGDCQFALGFPNLYRLDGSPSIEGELDTYMNENLPRCLKDFAIFTEQGYKIQAQATVATKTDVLDSEVAFDVKYPILIKRDNAAHQINEFYIRVPVKMKSIYEQARVLTTVEQKFHFLERDALNLIVGYSGVDEKKLPPMAASAFDVSGGKVWSRTNVKNLVQEMLMRDIPSLKVYQSENFMATRTGTALGDGLYNDAMLVKSQQTFPELGVTFDYLDFWPIYFNLNCHGEICKPESASSNLISLIGVQRYNFLYDLSYPVLITVTEPNALNSQGYTFQFFLEGNIRGNEPMNYSSNLNSNFAPLVSAAVTDESMLCDTDKRNSGEITIKVQNNGKPVEAAAVSFTCADESCPMGETKNGELDEKFPVCLGGLVTVIKDGYLSKSASLSTELGKKQTVSLEVEQKKTVGFNVKKYMLQKGAGSWSLRDNAMPLAEKEYAIVTFKRMGGLGEEEYNAYQIIYANSTKETIDLVPGKYAMEGVALLKDEIIIMPQKRCEDAGLKQVCYTVPTQKLYYGQLSTDEPANIGGIKSNITITDADLAKGKMTLYLVTVDLIDIPASERVIEDLDQVTRIGKYSAKIPPTFG